MAVTIYDIAQEVKTSAVTVSLALRDSKRVSAKTKTRIKEVAKKLGYQPNPLARGLIGAKTKTIAFVFNFPSAHLAHDLSYMELFHSIAQVASENGYKLFVHSAMTKMSIAEVYNDIRAYGVDGVILGTNIETQEDKDALKNAPIPTVLLCRDYCAKNTSCVLYGGPHGAKEAVHHFASLGHKRIAFAGKSEIEASVRRFQGYREGLEECGIGYEPELVTELLWDTDGGENASRYYSSLEKRPTAILAATDLMAIGMMAGFKEQGLEVPKDISIIGFDNLHISRFSVLSLSSVDLRRDLIAGHAMKSILSMINDKTEGERIEVASSLIIRNSTAKPSIVY